MPEVLLNVGNWAMNGLFLGALLYWAYKKQKPPAAQFAGSANTHNIQGSHNVQKKKTVKHVSSDALAWMQCANLESTVKKQQGTIELLEAQLMDRTLVTQEQLGLLKDKNRQIEQMQRTHQAIIDRYDREFRRMAAKLERLEYKRERQALLPIFELKTA